MNRLAQNLLITTFIAFSWLGMQVVHESGHVLAALMTGGHGITVTLHPLMFSRTELAENPHPLAVVWGGPIVGCIVPLLLFCVARLVRCPGIYLFRFFAGFCLVANGAYIGAGWCISGKSDPGVMMQNGSPVWLLVLFGLATLPVGLYLWHRQGRYFGLGESNGKVSLDAATASFALLVVLVGIELIWSAK